MIARRTSYAFLTALLVVVPACIADGGADGEGHEDPEGITAIDEGADAGERSAESVTGSVTVGGLLRTTADLNLRSGPSTSNSVLHVIPAGSRVTVVEATPRNGFYHVQHAGTRGWSYGAYLERVAAAPTCTATAKTGDYCGGDKVSSGSAATLYRCTGPGPATVVRVCSAGCVVAPAGTDDHCASTSGSTPAAESCPHVAGLLRWGLHPVASDRLRCAGVSSSRISQTIGNAAASAGTHAQDGSTAAGPYSAATDISVSGMSDAEVRSLIARLDALGFAAFFRNPGHDGWPSYEARHVHAVFVGAKMKSSLQSQVWDFLAGRNGLASHSTYSFYQPPASVKSYVKALFLDAN